VAAIDTDRSHGNLSSAIRLFVFDYYRAQIGEERSLRGDGRDLLHVPAAPSLMRVD
jgi:predicted DNA-binding ribbon-helix-helix protein